MEAKPERKKNAWLGWLVKGAVTALALWFVFTRISLKESLERIQHADPLWFVLAVLLFNVSKLISTLRFRSFLDTAGVQVSHGYNVRLYYIGAFYNFFLPGSVSGDAMKGFLLRQKYGTEVRALLGIILLDRLSGMVSLIFVSLLMLLLVPAPADWSWLPWVTGGLMLLCFPVYYGVMRLVFTRFLPAFHITNLQSLISIVIQVVFGACLLRALHLDGNYFAYLILFMGASVASTLPVSVGGLGARELVFLYGSQLLLIDPLPGTSMTLLVFGVLGISAIPGLILTFVRD